MKRFMITFYDESLGKIGRFVYYDYAAGLIKIPAVIKVLRRNGVITLKEQEQLTNCKCIMIEEDN